jgi:DNA-binding response OmpR family regulator
MPGLSGAELIAQLHGAGLTTMPIVLITASPCDVAPLLVLEAIVCLAKPFDLDDLLADVACFVQPLRDEHLLVERWRVGGACPN